MSQQVDMRTYGEKGKTDSTIEKRKKKKKSEKKKRTDRNVNSIFQTKHQEINGKVIDYSFRRILEYPKHFSENNLQIKRKTKIIL